MKVKRETNFINDGISCFLPRPSGVFTGLARHQWFEKLVGKKPSIASPDFWDILWAQYGIKKLVEYEDGTWEILEET